MIKNSKKWFETLCNFLAKKGHEGHTAVPVLIPGKRVLLTRPCPVCDNPWGFVFQSQEDTNTYLLACKKCKKITVRKKANNPVDAATQGMKQAVENMGGNKPITTHCGCGTPLPKGRKKFCYGCRPAHKNTSSPKEEDSQKAAVY